MSRAIPAWKILLEWILERGDVGLGVDDILDTRRRGRKLGASYRQRLADIRRKLGPGVIETRSEAVNGETHTTYIVPRSMRQAAMEMLAAGARPMTPPPVTEPEPEPETLFELGFPKTSFIEH